MYPISEGQIKKIHVIKAEIRMSEEDYRAMLKGMFNVAYDGVRVPLASD